MRHRHKVVHGKAHIASEGEEVTHEETMYYSEARPNITPNGGYDTVFQWRIGIHGVQRADSTTHWRR